MNDQTLKKICLLTDNKSKIDGLESVFTSSEITAAHNGESNAYSAALSILQAKREVIYAMPDE